MTAERERTLVDWNKQFEELMSNPKIWAAINKTLLNNGEEIDFDAWDKGCDVFMETNADLLKAWFNK